MKPNHNVVLFFCFLYSSQNATDRQNTPNLYIVWLLDQRHYSVSKIMLVEQSPINSTHFWNRTKNHRISLNVSNEKSKWTQSLLLLLRQPWPKKIILFLDVCVKSIFDSEQQMGREDAWQEKHSTQFEKQ